MLPHYSLVFRYVTLPVLFPFSGPQQPCPLIMDLMAKLHSSILHFPGNIMQASSLASRLLGVLVQSLQIPSIQICPASCRGTITEHETFYPAALILLINVYTWEDACQEECSSRRGKLERGTRFPVLVLLTEAHWRWKNHFNFPCLKSWVAFQSPWDKDPKPSQDDL